jgi:cell division transport system permease protein
MNTSRVRDQQQNRRRYDLPLHKDSGTLFLMVLVGLMTFLMALVLTFSVGLNQLMDGWSKGLENKVTIEIPAEFEDGTVRGSDKISSLQKEIFNALNDASYIEEIEITPETDLQALIKPWLGGSSLFDDLPMPGLMSVQIKADAIDALAQIKNVLGGIDSDIRLDTHEEWLADLFRLTQSMQIIILCFVVVIGLTTVAAVAGGVKAQIEIHRLDVELLHLMGAYDSYITRQFVRHSSIVVLIGGFCGVFTAVLILAGLGWFLGAQDYSILPDLDLDIGYFSVLLSLPFFIWAISAWSTRVTVMRVLKQMP